MNRMMKIVAAGLVLSSASPAAASAASAAAPDFVKREAVFWLDASTLPQSAGTELDSWPDVRGSHFPGATTYTDTRPQVIEIAGGDLDGKKAVTFFTVGTQCDMHFAENQPFRTAFFVVDLDQAQHAFLLGGPGPSSTNAEYFRFHRGSGGSYLLNSYGITADSCTYWNDGVEVSNPATTIIPTGYQLISFYGKNQGYVRNICSDRDIAGRIGGKRLCEVIAFNRALSAAERAWVEGYLKAKWFGDGTGAADRAVEMFCKKTQPQVRFDASDENSFSYEVEGDGTGTKVSQWDDLSGNDNHFVSNITAQTANYGTRGTVAEKPVFDSGTASSGIDLKLSTRLTNTRTVLMVAEVERSDKVFWLGDSSDYRFHRGAGGQFARNAGDSYDKNVYIRTDQGGEIWCNGGKVKNATGEYPDMPGGLSVYVIRTTKNCAWTRLGQDRTEANRNGGKRVAELMTFSTPLSDEDCETLSKILSEKWKPSDAYVDGVLAAAPVHVDASSAGNFNYDAQDRIVGWKNEGADLYRQSEFYLNKAKTTVAANYGVCGYTNGVPAFLMGGHGSKIDMAFSRLTNIRAVFWAMDIMADREDVFFLADWKESANDSRSYHFHRGANGAYLHTGYSAAGLRDTPVFCDSALVLPTIDRPPVGTHVYDMNSASALNASALSMDRDTQDPNDATGEPRNGGRALSELIVFSQNVSGLTREAIRRWLERKWLTDCGWAGAGDVEWGADSYRVFGADAAVPAEGAAAAGVGFTGNALRATLSGGTLTLGDGGIFAAEGTEITVSAPLAGKVGAYGPGRVTVTEPLGAVDSISVGYGATLTVVPGRTTVAGDISVRERGRIVLDVSSFAEGQYASISFGGLALPEGAMVFDCVSLSDDTANALSLSADGTTLEINATTAPAAAVWNGGEDVGNAANWTCRNMLGEVLADALPSAHSTTSVVFNAACDLRTLGAVGFNRGAHFDLNGNVVRVANLGAADYLDAVITNSAATTAELRVEVADGVTVTNDSAAILGDIKLVKDGKGTFVAAKQAQTCTGGVEINDGTLRVTSPGNQHQLGAIGTEITVRRGATFDVNGQHTYHGYVFVLDGGTFANHGNDLPSNYGQLRAIRLTADSAMDLQGSYGFYADQLSASELDLGGHVLTVEIGSGKRFYLQNTTVRNGTLNIASGGTLYVDNGGTATNADVRVNCALDVRSAFGFGNYTAVYGGNSNSGTATLDVCGTFTPAPDNDCFYGCTMLDGSTIDLSGRTGSWSTVSSFSGGSGTMSFAEGATVTVRLAGREDLRAIAKSANPHVVTWTARPENVRFVLDAETAAATGMRLIQDADGVRLLPSGLIVVIR